MFIILFSAKLILQKQEAMHNPFIIKGKPSLAQFPLKRKKKLIFVMR